MKFKDVENGYQMTVEYVPHENKLYRELRDILSPDVLRANAQDQARQISPRSRKGVMMQFSPGDYSAIVRRFPDLESKDRNVRNEAWRRLSRDKAFKPFHRTRFPGEDTFFVGGK